LEFPASVPLSKIPCTHVDDSLDLFDRSKHLAHDFTRDLVFIAHKETKFEVLIVQIYASCQGSWEDDLRDCNSPKESHLRNFWSTSFARAVCTKSPVATSKHVIANFQHIWFLLI